ncbi:hypothetical protein BGZ97_002162 [Linnemannia gamsii]|uniref:Uncharacterized protein n=1 Tax=Linnemannia gamsii TaxID=64522 RepID=A0A9P6QVE8_9FUNG|nr:hypothetical protein BGZ97_002162 [Linnemannia gamsii]
MKIKEAEERVAQLEEEVAVQEKKFPTVAMGLGPCLVEEDLKLLKSKIRETKHEMDRLLRVRGGSATQTTTLSPPTGTGAGAWGEGEQPGFCMDYEESDEAILEQFLARFPQLQTLMTTSIPFLNQGVIRNMVGLDNLRYLSLTIFNAISPGQVSNVHTLLNTSPPNLEILRLSFLDKDDGTADLLVTDKPRSRGSSDSTVPATATSPTAEMFSTSSSASGPTTMATNLGATEYEGDANLDLVRLSIQRSGPLRSLRRLFIEGTLALPGASTVNQHRSPDSQTWIAFLERCPNLLTLSLGGCSAHVLPDVGQAVKLYCPRLEDLVVGHKSYLSTPSHELLDPNLAILLSSITNLKRLRIDTLSLETNSQVLSVIQHRFAESLTELSLNDCKYHRLRYQEESHSIFNFLRSLPNLESMDLLPSGEMFHTFEHALGCSRFVSEVFSKPWTCRGALRVLRINIDGILRKTATYSMTREQDLKQSRLLQRRVCEFLGSLLQLEELSLGVLASAPRQKATTCWGGSGDYGIFDRSVYLPSAEDQEHGPVYGAFKFAGIQHSCLALSLSCGLELMSGLKRLKIFNVARMNHLIETEEIEFMVEQWPKLEFLPGLLRWPWFQRESGEPEAEWLEQKRQVLERDESMVLWMKEKAPFLRYS